VDVLLSAGCDANIRTELQMTPLLVAAFNGHVSVIQRLLAHGVDMEQHGPCGGTALYVAAQEGRNSVAEILLQKGAQVDASCDGQLTPSLIAAMQGHAEMVRLLLAGGGELSVRTDKGSTLAIMAARHGQTHVLKVLVELSGAQILDDTNAEDLSALAAAKAGRHSEATAYIKSVIAVRKEADLIAWEASLPDILQELSPPRKESKKSKRKPKVGGKRPREVSSQVVQSCDSEVVKDKHAISNISEDTDGVRSSIETDIVDVDTENTPIVNCLHFDAFPTTGVDKVGCTLDSKQNQDKDSVGCRDIDGPWLSVKRKGSSLTSLSKEVESNTCTSRLADAVGPTHPVSVLKARQCLAPMLSQIPDVLPSAPATPSLQPSTWPSTPCTSSPFGLPTVLPLWPATPDPFGLQDGFSPGFFAALPPAFVDAAPSFPALPESFHFPPFGSTSFTCNPFAQTAASRLLPSNSIESMFAQVTTPASIRSTAEKPGSESTAATCLLLE
jgi:hypothetical protein